MIFNRFISYNPFFLLGVFIASMCVRKVWTPQEPRGWKLSFAIFRTFQFKMLQILCCMRFYDIWLQNFKKHHQNISVFFFKFWFGLVIQLVSCFDVNCCVRKKQEPKCQWYMGVSCWPALTPGVESKRKETKRVSHVMQARVNERLYIKSLHKQKLIALISYQL